MRKIDCMRKILGLTRTGPVPRVCVEAGTADGGFAKVMPRLFPVCHTIERSPEMFASVGEMDGVTRHLGDSRDVVPELMRVYDEPVLWYLDSHFCHGYENRGGAAGESDFPLWEELRLLGQRPFPDIVVVDDVHTFGRVRGPKFGDWENVNAESLSAALGRVSVTEFVGDMFAMWRAAD